jgi:cytochrome oxidase assembly protein ShyY1
VTTDNKKRPPTWLLFSVGALLVVQFAALSVWQINRGLEKRASRASFKDQSGFTHFVDGTEVRAYQSIEVGGNFISGQQFLLDNIILNSRYGYYVLTPFELGEGTPLLIVNRGWIERTASVPAIEVSDAPLSVRGRVGSLPKTGTRKGEAIVSRESWPQVTVWPSLADLQLSLGSDLQPFVLLMDPEADKGFLRHWVPAEMGPGKHFGYALQWFAMAAALAGILIWNFRKKTFAT